MPSMGSCRLAAAELKESSRLLTARSGRGKLAWNVEGGCSMVFHSGNGGGAIFANGTVGGFLAVGGEVELRQLVTVQAVMSYNAYIKG